MHLCNFLKSLMFCVILFSANKCAAQELFPSSEPASNMSAKSIGLRLNNQINDYKNSFSMVRINPEIMWGINKKWMMHVDAYAGNLYQKKFIPEQLSLYTKYRFLSNDNIQSHFRMAVFGRLTLGNNNVLTDSMMINYTSGYNAGVVLTQLIHKVALSSTLSFQQNWSNNSASINYIFSSGYLLFPRHYSKYNQLNCNLYFELIGKNMISNNQFYIDAAPAIQFIINSVARIDFLYQTKLAGSDARKFNNAALIKLEYNFLNAY
jgi:hypothetical protein